MNEPGDASDLLVKARSALLDALEALAEHRDAIVIVGAQAIYLHTGSVDVALAEATKDSDLAVDPTSLSDEPLVEEAMIAAGFYLDPISNQPGAWMNSAGVPVDLMVPEALAGAGGKGARAGRIPPHARSSTRRARGLEAAVVDHQPMRVDSLNPSDLRTFEANVAGPAALLVAKLHKLGERQITEDRLVDKDAHDIYRVFRAIQTTVLASGFQVLLENDISGDATDEALSYLASLFGTEESLGAVMAGRAEEGIGNPEEVTASVVLLARDLTERLEQSGD
jgi:hypothetical protein